MTKVDRADTSYGQMQNHRDDRVVRYTTKHPKNLKGHTIDDVQKLLNKTGLIDEVREAFRQFKTADMYVDAREGDRLNLPNAIEYLSGNSNVERLFYGQERAEVGDRARDSSSSRGAPNPSRGVCRMVPTSEIA